MPTRGATYAFARPVPYLLQRGVTQELQGPVRHGATGALVEPTSGTVTIVKRDGTNFVSDAAVTVSSSTATYEVTPSASETLGSGWRVEWTLVIDSQTYLFREAAYLCEWVPHNTVSVVDLYKEIPALRTNVPAAQDVERGDGTGWQPQIDEAYYDFTRVMLDDGRPVWRVREHSTGVREWVLSKALLRCCRSIPRTADSTWGLEEKRMWQRHEAAKAALKLQYDDEPAGTRKAGHPYYRMGPPGRPLY